MQEKRVSPPIYFQAVTASYWLDIKKIRSIIKLITKAYYTSVEI